MRYMGGKFRLRKPICKILNGLIKDYDIKTYVEPFVGGCNIVPFIECENRIASDISLPLISMYEALQNGWTPPDFVSEEEYKAARLLDDTNPLKAFIGYGCSWGGDYFHGYARRNDGGKRIDSLEAKISLIKLNLQGIDFLCCKYEMISVLSFLCYGDNALYYCDPPYRNTTKYKFDFNHDEFYEWARRVSKHNIVVISEYNMPEDFICVL